MAVVLDAYRDDPVRFVEEVLGDKPYSKQRKMLEEVAQHRRVSVVGANGSGKDWVAARVILWWLATRMFAKVVVTGPTQRQVQEIVWRELRAAYKGSLVPLGGRMSGSQWIIDDDRFAIGFSTNKADNLQGFHSPELLVIVTEAHAMPQDQMEALKRLNPTRVLLTGNAFSRDGEFFDSHHTKGDLYRQIAISAFDTPNFTGENGGIPGMPTEEDIAERKLDWGVDHPLYQGSVLGRFPDMLDDSLIGRAAIEQAVARWEQDCHSEQSAAEPRNLSGSVPPFTDVSPERCFDSASGSAQHDKVGASGSAQHDKVGASGFAQHDNTPPPPASLSMTALPPYDAEPRRLGVDVARFGSDKTALCVRQGWRVESLRSFERIDTMRTAGEATVLVRERGIPAVFVDEGGLGAGVVDRLRELGAPVHGVQFGGKAPQSGRFANMRAEIFWELRRLFNDGLIAIPRDEELISQLLALRYDVTSAGQVKMESKTSLRKRGVRSPDKADALALAFMEPPSLRIWTGYEPSVVPEEAGRALARPRPPRPVRDSTDVPASDGDGPPPARNFGVWW